MSHRHPHSRCRSAITRLATLLATLAAGLALAACQDEGQATHMVGTLERDRIEMTVETTEPIAEIAVADGQVVTTGELLLRQDDRRYQARLAQAEAQRDQAAGRLAELRRGPREETIKEAQANLLAVQAQVTNSQSEYEREKTIFEKGLSGQAAVDRRKNLLDADLAQEKAVREELASLLNGTTVEELEQAEAAHRAAQAAVEQARVDLSRLALYAPSPARVDKVWWEVGERPTPGQAVAVLMDNARVYARIYVPEHQKAAVSVGDSLNVQLDGHAQTLRGTVSWVSADATFTPYFALTEYDRSRVSYLAEVKLDDAHDLPSGLPLEAWPD
ncbi:HlyD family efflux transporter periplasmic adaptor subunit [Marinihelvus fidelis]|uniref:HlyD family efflux transporter periplasmic adaptor subunit n=1 Tax=Marinihelvus fidelis TaxID=2613842 RepID=A0A5N0T459_9GAMM|nr:HlyD family efflux transporter periplasmic adaptor subunit [Marinihelvus fidelis]KAA9129693.1 HlyD family efflux transporter periplasmic adaptor subunit [Marinihelvus fidelis]